MISKNLIQITKKINERTIFLKMFSKEIIHLKYNTLFEILKDDTIKIFYKYSYRYNMIKKNLKSFKN